MKRRQKFKIDITGLVAIQQKRAAVILGISSPTLSRKWKKAYPDNIWPYIKLSRIDRMIKRLLDSQLSSPQIDAGTEKKIHDLFEQRKKEIKGSFYLNL